MPGVIWSEEKRLAVFFDRLKKYDNNGCWEWMDTVSGTGYGLFYTYSNGVKYKELAHRYAYRKLVGPISNGLNVLHRCDNRKCCNPWHLFLGTPADNVRDMCLKGRRADSRRFASKLSDTQVIEITHSTLPLRKIAAIYGMSYSCIRAIKSGVSWSHLTKISKPA